MPPLQAEHEARLFTGERSQQMLNAHLSRPRRQRNLRGKVEDPNHRLRIGDLGSVPVRPLQPDNAQLFQIEHQRSQRDDSKPRNRPQTPQQQLIGPNLRQSAVLSGGDGKTGGLFQVIHDLNNTKLTYVSLQALKA